MTRELRKREKQSNVQKAPAAFATGAFILLKAVFCRYAAANAAPPV